MSYADISTSSLELVPSFVSSGSVRPRTSRSAVVPAAAPAQSPARYLGRALPLHEQALYVMLAVNFAVMVYGFIGMIG